MESNFKNFETEAWTPIDATRRYVRVYRNAAYDGYVTPTVTLALASEDGGKRLVDFNADPDCVNELIDLIDAQARHDTETKGIDLTFKVLPNLSTFNGSDAVLPVEVGTGRKIRNVVACKVESGVNRLTELTITVCVDAKTE